MDVSRLNRRISRADTPESGHTNKEPRGEGGKKEREGRIRKGKRRGESEEVCS